MRKRGILLVLVVFLCSLGVGSFGQTLPPKEADESHVIVPPGQCSGGLIEVGTWKKELSEQEGHDVFWARNPRQFVEPCEVFVEKTWVARYRLAVRCVRQSDHAVFSGWVRSLSKLGQPWPNQCDGYQPGQPLVDAVQFE